ncbi:hypothetical protein B9Z19DRAFT_5332 [Tuber borchii]|uniref:Uncharacterized protein n=1 Tax=Tuber borchii TaxID=42251 RepID=A0A2T7A9G1_TUBBO|nr:hypothetical protein B9Z19DRAFT_5332 [Tuber borchii]
MLSNILAWDFPVSEQSFDFRSLFGACGGRHRIKLELLVQLPYKNNDFANSHLLDVEKAEYKKEERILQGTRTRLFFTNLILFRLAFVPRRRNLISCSLETRAPFFTGEPLWLLYYEDELPGKKKTKTSAQSGWLLTSQRPLLTLQSVTQPNLPAIMSLLPF